MRNQFIIYLFIISALFSTNLQAENFDSDILKHIHTNRNTALDKPMQGISNSLFVIIPLTPASLFATGMLKGDREMSNHSIQIAISGAVSGITAYCLKQIIKRERPFVKYDFIENTGKETDYSMPSMHSAFAFSLATSLSLQYPQWYVIVPSYLWSSLVAYSRMHLGVHYLTDVLVGALVGAGISYLTFQIEKNFKWPSYVETSD